MTVSTETEQKDRRSLDVVRIAAPVLALVSLFLAVATSNLELKLQHFGLTLMMASMTAYVFHLKGRPTTARPPVTFDSVVMLLIVVFCLGTFFCGIGMSGLFGFAMQFLPTIAAIGVGAWLTSAKGQAKRAEWATRDS